jgi:hypothetical protein
MPAASLAAFIASLLEQTIMSDNEVYAALFAGAELSVQRLVCFSLL